VLRRVRQLVRRAIRPASARRLEHRDEWDMALSDGGLPHLRDRETGRWFVGAVVD
jgi:hypothetical protein